MTLPRGAYYLEGRGDELGIILCHAYTGSPADVRPQANLLQRQGYGVLCPLFKGHGTGDIVDILAVAPQEWWQDMVAAIDFMKTRYRYLMLFGLSMGGVMAMKALCQEDPAIIGGGVFNSPVVSRVGLRLADRFMSYARALAQKKGQESLFQDQKDQILADHLRQVALIQDFAQSFEAELAHIKLPLYIVQSGKDELIEPEAVYDLLDALEGARISFYWCEQNTHVITIDRQRSDFETSLLQFITQVKEQV